MKKNFCLLILIFISQSAFCQSDSVLTSTQQQQLIANLNYIQYSLGKIKSSNNKAIAEDVFYSIINEIDIKTINNNELRFAYRGFLTACAELKLKENEKEFIKYISDKERKLLGLDMINKPA